MRSLHSVSQLSQLLLQAAGTELREQARRTSVCREEEAEAEEEEETHMRRLPG